MGIRPMAWSPLGGGSLFSAGVVRDKLDQIAGRLGTDAAALAVAWLLAHPAGILPVMGTNTIARIKGFQEAARLKIDRQTWFELYTAALGREVA